MFQRNNCLNMAEFSKRFWKYEVKVISSLAKDVANPVARARVLTGMKAVAMK